MTFQSIFYLFIYLHTAFISFTNNLNKMGQLSVIVIITITIIVFLMPGMKE